VTESVLVDSGLPNPEAKVLDEVARRVDSKEVERMSYLQESAELTARSAVLWGTGRQNAPSARVSPERPPM
jgi:hypothetical protein